MKARDADELTLSFLRFRHDGYTSGQIGARFGVPAERVRTATVRVAKDDTAVGDADMAGFYTWFNDRTMRAK